MRPRRRTPTARKVLGIIPAAVFVLSSTAFGFTMIPSPPSFGCSRSIQHSTTQRPIVVLFGEPSEGSNNNKASVRFSGTEGFTSTTDTNPLDALLTVLASDVASIALGLLGLIVVVAHRGSLLMMMEDTTTLSAADSLTVQTRTDLLAVFACGSVLLNGITKLDVTAALAETVVLEGTKLDSIQVLLADGMVQQPHDSASSSTTVVWALESLLAATPATTAILLEREARLGSTTWRVTARGGIVPPINTKVPESTPILDRVSSAGNDKETYLPTLQALPGKRELPYLPVNAQLALLVPIRQENNNNNNNTSQSGGPTTTRVLVLGSNRAKSFSPRDVAWCRIVAERMASARP